MPADVAFMHGMIAHHAQALAMADLAAARTTARDVRTLAERIAVSQREEIALMQQWLRTRGHAPPSHDPTRHAHGDTLMPGMLTAPEMRILEDARGDAFDRAFLTLMIRHHQGALTMVERLLASPGGTRDPEIHRFAADVDADQRAEIARMRRLLAARTSPTGDARHRFNR